MVQQGEVQSPGPGEKQAHVPVHAEGRPGGSSLAEKDQGSRWSQQWAPYGKEAQWCPGLH